MSYAIFRCQSINTLNDLSHIGSHNKREKEFYKSNPDIRKEDSKNNIQLVKCDKKYREKFYEMLLRIDPKCEFNSDPVWIGLAFNDGVEFLFLDSALKRHL